MRSVMIKQTYVIFDWDVPLLYVILNWVYVNSRLTLGHLVRCGMLQPLVFSKQSGIFSSTGIQQALNIWRENK